MWRLCAAPDASVIDFTLLPIQKCVFAISTTAIHRRRPLSDLLNPPGSMRRCYRLEINSASQTMSLLSWAISMVLSWSQTPLALQHQAPFSQWERLTGLAQASPCLVTCPLRSVDSAKCLAEKLRHTRSMVKIFATWPTSKASESQGILPLSTCAVDDL